MNTQPIALTPENFSGLIKMFNSGSQELQDAIKAAADNRSSENTYQVAFELYRILKPYQIHFIAGNVELWMQSVRQMHSLAFEAAGVEEASNNALCLAGVITASEWVFKGFDPAVVSDIPTAVRFFQRGAHNGCETCEGNLLKAQAILTKQAPSVPSASESCEPSV